MTPLTLITALVAPALPATVGRWLPGRATLLGGAAGLLLGYWLVYGAAFPPRQAAHTWPLWVGAGVALGWRRWSLPWMVLLVLGVSALTQRSWLLRGPALSSALWLLGSGLLTTLPLHGARPGRGLLLTASLTPALLLMGGSLVLTRIALAPLAVALALGLRPAARSVRLPAGADALLMTSLAGLLLLGCRSAELSPVAAALALALPWVASRSMAVALMLSGACLAVAALT